MSRPGRISPLTESDIGMRPYLKSEPKANLGGTAEVLPFVPNTGMEGFFLI